jgi:hypothetical protein
MQIYHPLNVFPIKLPSFEDSRALMEISRDLLFPRAPSLNDLDRQEFLASFILSLQFLSTVKRTSELTRADRWVDHCRNWQSERTGRPVDISLSAFLAATAASGDIPFQYDPTTWPYNIAIGLSWHDGIVASPAWKLVLEKKMILTPTLPPKSEPYPEQTIRQLDMIHGHGARPFG